MRKGFCRLLGALVLAAFPAAADGTGVAKAPTQPDLRAAEVDRLVFAEAQGADAVAERQRACPAGPDLVPCLLRLRLASDPRAVEVAEDLYARTGSLVGVETAQTMDGGFRGILHLVPAPPVGAARTHLEWVSRALLAHDDFFRQIAPLAPGPIAYRWKPLALQFFRSVGGHRPSAYAHGWTIAYNVTGSLNLSADDVRETLFHEVFHLNDAAHGGWSRAKLGALYDPIVARCGTRMACLAPYAPNRTVVRGGTYYAFQPGNGDTVNEYAAELAVRYYREERAALEGKPERPAFKCGPPENGQAWALLVSEFFGGVDRTPACP